MTVSEGQIISGVLTCAPNARNNRDLDIVIKYKAGDEAETTIQYKMCVVTHVTLFRSFTILFLPDERTLTGCQVLIVSYLTGLIIPLRPSFSTHRTEFSIPPITIIFFHPLPPKKKLASITMHNRHSSTIHPHIHTYILYRDLFFNRQVLILFTCSGETEGGAVFLVTVICAAT